jgi:hypothetical protein
MKYRIWAVVGIGIGKIGYGSEVGMVVGDDVAIDAIHEFVFFPCPGKTH